jgi:hypothetical protein
MRYHYDWEFKEDGITIEPISLGMVDDNGRELYLINTAAVRAFQEREYFNKLDSTDIWLKANVFNHISEADIEQYGLGVSDPGLFRTKAATHVYNFILDGLGYSDVPELWGYFAAYDHVCLSQLFGRMIDLPSPMPMFTNDLMTIGRKPDGRWKAKPPRPDSLPLHHSLMDAKYQQLIFKEWYEC